MWTCNQLDLPTLGSQPVMPKNRLLGKNRLSLKNNQLKFETSGELPIILEDSIEYTSNEWKQNRKMSTCDRLGLESLGSWPIMPKNFVGIRLNNLIYY